MPDDARPVYPFQMNKNQGRVIYSTDGVAIQTDFGPRPEPSEQVPLAPRGPVQPEQPRVSEDPKEGSAQAPVDSPEGSSSTPETQQNPEGPTVVPPAQPSATGANTQAKQNGSSKQTS